MMAAVHAPPPPPSRAWSLFSRLATPWYSPPATPTSQSPPPILSIADRIAQSRTSSEQDSPLSTPPRELSPDPEDEPDLDLDTEHLDTELLAADHTPTPAPHARTLPETHRALLLLSVQRAPLADPAHGGMPGAPRVRRALTQILSAARRADPPPLVVHVRHGGEAGEPDARGSRGWELWTDVRPGEAVLDKAKTSAWSGTRLGAMVAPEAELVVVGCASDSCVRMTCREALARGNTVLLIRDAHCAHDRAAMYAGPHGVVLPAHTVERQVEHELEAQGVIVMDMDDVPGIFHDR